MSDLNPEASPGQAARDLLYQTVATPSLSGEESAVAQLLVCWMRQQGFEAAIDQAGNAIGQRGRGPISVVLLGHMDTVPGDILVHVDQDLVLHGRGSVDAKGSLCAFLGAVAQLPPEALQAARFVCIGAVEEEAPSSKGARFVRERYQPDYVLIGEPSGWAGLTLGYKGRLVAKVCLSKPNFHTAGEGTSAADDLLEGWFRLRAYAQRVAPEQGIFHRLQATVQGLEANMDGLTQRAQATLGFRVPPELPLGEVEGAVRAAFSDLSPQTEVNLTFTGHEPPIKHPKDNALTRALRVAIRAQGGTPVFKVKTGTSDMNVVAQHWPVPTLAYGPGDSALDHTPEERLSLQEYDRAVAVLVQALSQLVGAG